MSSVTASFFRLFLSAVLVGPAVAVLPSNSTEHFIGGTIGITISSLFLQWWLTSLLLRGWLVVVVTMLIALASGLLALYNLGQFDWVPAADPTLVSDEFFLLITHYNLSAGLFVAAACTHRAVVILDDSRE